MGERNPSRQLTARNRRSNQSAHGLSARHATKLPRCRLRLPCKRPSGASSAPTADSSVAALIGGEVVTPMVVFVNSKSGGRHGPGLKVRLHELISKEQVTTCTLQVAW
ncbi:hypothetical protein ZWY2020_003070 [Hordeum vulgare]|nr:hypothetical protein ZWY2020_003070 [Hordeum vulgare]